jgi:calmodulin
MADEDTKLCFELFDKDGSGNISAADCATALRTLGKAPSGEELEELLGGASTVNYAKFKEILDALPPPNFDEVMDAFSTFDTHGQGYMSLSELLHIMKNLGEGLSDAVLAKVKEAAEPDQDNQVNFRHFVEKMVKDL